MEKIKIGTCVPGDHAQDLIPHFVKAGFECISLNFHMEYNQKPLPELAQEVKAALGDSGVTVSSIGFYCNALENQAQRKTLEEFIDNAPLFGTDVVTTFAGALEGQPVEKAYPVFQTVFGELTRRAEAKGVRIAMENCPMGGVWQSATCNIAFNPLAWAEMFSLVDSKAIGLEWEPAHQMVQLIDPIPQLDTWKDKIFHVHGKDCTVDWNIVKTAGVFGTKEFATPRTPGFGDTNWRDVFFKLYQNGYLGDICLEGFHDPIYQGEWEMTGQLHGLAYLNWCRGGNPVKNPW